MKSARAPSAVTCSAMSRDVELFQRPQAAGHAAPEGRALDTGACKDPPHRYGRGRTFGRRATRHSRHRRAGQSQHLAQPDQLRQGRRAVARGRQGPLQGRADPRDRCRQRARSVRGDREGQGRLRTPADRIRRRGCAEARCARGQRDLSEERVHLSRRLRPSAPALRRCRCGARERRSRAGAALPDVADRTRADRDQRRHCGARHQRPLRRLHLDPCTVLLGRHLRQDHGRALQHLPLHRRHRRRRLRRQGRHLDRAARHPRRDADGTPRALRVRSRGGDAVWRRAAPNASTSRTA